MRKPTLYLLTLLSVLLLLVFAPRPVYTQAGGLQFDTSGNAKVIVNAALPALTTGSNIVGRVGIDQTTPGITDSVSVATAQGAGATIGLGADAAVTTNTIGTLSGKLRGLVAIFADVWDGTNNFLRISHIDSGGSDMTDSTAHSLKVSVQNGSATGTEDASIASGLSDIALVTPLSYGYNATATAWTREYLDPCKAGTKAYKAISQAANAVLVTGTASKKTYICSLVVVGADAENISIVAGTGSTCGTNTVAVVGGATAATGPNLAANGGFALGNGESSVAATTVNQDDLCLFQSGSGRVAGVLTTAVQ